MLYCIYMSVKASIQQVLDLVYFLSECASQVEKKKDVAVDAQCPSINCRAETEWLVRDYTQINQSTVTLHHIGAVCDCGCNL